MIGIFLNEFVREDWKRFKAFWFRGVWSRLPFVFVSKRTLYNMHFDVSDHAVYHTVKNWSFDVKRDREID